MTTTNTIEAVFGQGGPLINSLGARVSERRTVADLGEADAYIDHWFRTHGWGCGAILVNGKVIGTRSISQH